MSIGSQQEEASRTMLNNMQTAGMNQATSSENRIIIVIILCSALFKEYTYLVTCLNYKKNEWITNIKLQNVELEYIKLEPQQLSQLPKRLKEQRTMARSDKYERLCKIGEGWTYISIEKYL